MLSTSTVCTRPWPRSKSPNCMMLASASSWALVSGGGFVYNKRSQPTRSALAKDAILTLGAKIDLVCDDARLLMPTAGGRCSPEAKSGGCDLARTSRPLYCPIGHCVRRGYVDAIWILDTKKSLQAKHQPKRKKEPFLRRMTRLGLAFHTGFVGMFARLVSLLFLSPITLGHVTDDEVFIDIIGKSPSIQIEAIRVSNKEKNKT